MGIAKQVNATDVLGVIFFDTLVVYGTLVMIRLIVTPVIVSDLQTAQCVVAS